MTPSSPLVPLRVLLVHNRYQQRGGEDVVFEEEAALLDHFGIVVGRLVVDNEEILPRRSPTASARLAIATVWSRSGAVRVRDAIRSLDANVVHFHNTFPLVSPAAYATCRNEGAAVVQTLHNYRLLCPAATFFRDGRPCEECLGKTVPWPGAVHGCYRESRSASTVTATMLAVHNLARTWARRVDVYIALTEFGRQKFIAGGLPPDKVVIKPNFVYPDPGLGTGRGEYAVFVGRLTPEKGIPTLLAAWERLGGRIPLKVVGDGPLGHAVASAVGRLSGVEWLGQRPSREIASLVGDAAVLVFPSEWYEGFGLTAIEALAVGTPVIAADLGAMSSLIDHERTGFHFPAGDPIALAAVVERAWMDSRLRSTMRRAARAEFEARYTAESNVRMLTAIYGQALVEAARRGSR